MKNFFRLACISALFIVMTGCSSQKKTIPLAYLSLEIPKGVITTQASNNITKEFPRGGFYVGNWNFRPAPDIQSYIEETHREANAKILRNADITLNVPFAFDILFFGYNGATDTVSVTAM